MTRSNASLVKLKRELAAEYAAAQGKTRWQVVQTYARKKKNGRVMYCTPSHDEIATGFGDDGWASNGKVIYDSKVIALLAARDLMELGVKKLRAYECHRSKSGHAHLTSKRRPGWGSATQ